MRSRPYLLVGLISLACLASGPMVRAQVLIERTVSVDRQVNDGFSFLSSVLNWSDASLSQITWTAVTLNFSSGSPTSPMVLGDLSSTLRFGTSTEGFTTAPVFIRGGLTNASQTFTLADNFDGAWKSSGRWELRVTDSVQGGIARLDSWKLSVMGLATNSAVNLNLSDGQKISTATGEGTDAQTTVASTLSFSTNTVTAEALAGKVLSLAGGVSGSGTLETATAAGGTVVLSGSSTNFTGTVRVSGSGTTEIASAGALGSGLLIQSNSQSTLRMNFTGTLTNALSVYNVSFGTNGTVLSGPVTVNNADFEVDSGDTNTVSGEVNGSGTVTKLGGGTLVLSGTNNSYTNITDIQNGTLRAVTVANSGNNSSIGAGPGLTIGSSSNAGTFVHTGSYLTNAMNREVLVGSAGGTFSVEHANSRVTLTGNVANQTTNAATLTKAGAGTLALGSGANVSVSTIAVQHGTLLLGAANTIGDTTGITMAGGTLDTAGLVDNVGTLRVTANSSIAGMNGNFVFSDIDLSTYAGATLNFIGNYVYGSSFTLISKSIEGYGSLNNFESKIQFGSTGLRGQLSFAGGITTLTAIPEPRVYVGAGILALLIGYTEYRRRRKSLAVKDSLIKA